jgi:hypothetical protein
MKHFNCRTPCVFAAVALLITTSSSSLSAQVATEPGTAMQLAPHAGYAGSSHRFVLFQGDAPAAAAPASDLQVNTLLHETAARDRRSRTLAGAAAGLVIGAGATYLLLQQGGSRSLCNRDTNQDAIHARGCQGLYVVGGALGAGVGALIGSRVGR